MLSIYCTLHVFVIILDTGVLPYIRSKSFIIPIFKSKGNSQLPGNYRPSSILSCLDKLFTSVLNERLTLELDTFLSKTKQNQTGFWIKTRYVGSFTLKFLIDYFSVLFWLYAKYQTKTSCCIVDFAKSFDNLPRPHLFQKLINNNKKGKFYTCHLNSSPVNAEWGENLSPILISLFLCDLENFLLTNGNDSITTLYSRQVKLYFAYSLRHCFTFADDTVLIASSPENYS